MKQDLAEFIRRIRANSEEMMKAAEAFKEKIFKERNTRYSSEEDIRKQPEISRIEGLAENVYNSAVSLAIQLEPLIKINEKEAKRMMTLTKMIRTLTVELTKELSKPIPWRSCYRSQLIFKSGFWKVEQIARELNQHYASRLSTKLIN